MSSIPALAPLPVANTSAPLVPLDADFDARWDAWVMRGHAHERLVRRRLVVLAGVLAMAMALVYAYMR